MARVFSPLVIFMSEINILGFDHCLQPLSIFQRTKRTFYFLSFLFYLPIKGLKL